MYFRLKSSGLDHLEDLDITDHWEDLDGTELCPNTEYAKDGFKNDGLQLGDNWQVSCSWCYNPGCPKVSNFKFVFHRHCIS